MFIMFGKYAAPAMEEVDMVAYADCRCGCRFIGGSGSGGQSGVEEQLYDWYRELHRRFEYQYSQRIQKHVSIQNLNADTAKSKEQENKLLLPKPMFSPRDVRILQSILNGKKYECIAHEQTISLSSVKKRVRFLYDRLNLRDRASFMNSYEGYTIELEGSKQKSEGSRQAQTISPPSSGALQGFAFV
ncbi:MAG: LuxR C-terminal-related transcriptional regulator [Treponema sp.]|jgi:DNA-binding CsgD family transcriptional regulator|nr:LuxR C-terminal-related transcriptional regulator [Treponema sp.]